MLIGAYQLVLTGLAIAWTVLPERRWAVAVLAAWDTLACCYLASIWLALRGNRLLAEVGVDTDRLPRARFTPAGSRATLLLTLVTSLAGMAAAGRVVIVGQHTDCCVRHTSYDAFLRGLEVVVPADATAVFQPLSEEAVEARQEQALDYLRTFYGVRVVPAADLLGETGDALAQPGRTADTPERG
jgi:hypothetical protein